jgi:AcrR family transcriptional regulator
MRREAILAAAREALEGGDYRDIRLDDLAGSLGLVKGSLYRYFPTKQDLFMALYLAELEAWLADWGARYAACEGGGEALAEAMLGSLEARPLLVRLIGCFPGDLEPELSDDGLLSYKRHMLGYLRRASEALGGLRALMGDRAGIFLVSVFSLIQGAAPICYPVSRVAALLTSDPAFGPFRIGLRELLGPLLRAAIREYAG